LLLRVCSFIYTRFLYSFPECHEAIFASLRRGPRGYFPSLNCIDGESMTALRAKLHFAPTY